MKKPRTFRPAHLGSVDDARTEYERRRGSARQRGYDGRWDAASGSFKQLHPLCLGCRAVGRFSATEVVDHIVPHRGDMELFWDIANWQPACRWHHDAIKAHLEVLFDKGEAGKADLRLDSLMARNATHQMMATPS